MDNLSVMNNNFYSQFFSHGDLVYDVGANIGDWADNFLRHGAGEVVAVEPQQELCKLLAHRFREKPVKCLQCAVGADRGFAKLLQCNVHTIASLNPIWTAHRFAGYDWHEGEEVMVVTLDEIIGHYGKPRFMKLDIEGYEAEAFKGLSVPVDGLCWEYTAEIILQLYECLNLIERFANYEYSYTFGDYPSFKCEWTSRSTVTQSIMSQMDNNLWGNIYARRIQ